MVVTPFTAEQSRLLVNLRQRYEVWIDAESALKAMPYALRRKPSGGRTYLYRIHDRGGNGTSLGPMNQERQQELTDYQKAKDELKARRDTAKVALAESASLYRALRLPMLSSDAGPILRECDRRGLLGSHLLVIGTNVLSAYMLEANGRIMLADETEDFDLAWVAEQVGPDDQPLWQALKAVDPTYSVNTERSFQARNARAYEVELLVAPSRAATLGAKDQPRPVALPEQEWLLLGRPVDQVVGCRDGTPARIVAPDPRWFALHKYWLSEQPKRNPLKRRKDAEQGRVMLAAVREAMPHYPVDAAFVASVPEELRGFLDL